MNLHNKPVIFGALLASSLLTASAHAVSASVVITDRAEIVSQYYYPTDWNNPASLNYPRMFFELPGNLLGASVNSATLSFTGQLYGSGPTASVEMIRAPGPNQTIASGVVYPFNYGQYASVDVATAVNGWLGAGVSRVQNNGLLVRLDSGFADLTNGNHSTVDYRPTLTIEYTPTIASTKADQIVTAGQSALGEQWSFNDVAALHSLYLAGGGTQVIDGETWYYTANEYSTGGSWGGPREIGEAWIDGNGYKHIYLGSGLTTAPVPEPATYAQLLVGLAALAGLLRRRRAPAQK